MFNLADYNELLTDKITIVYFYNSNCKVFENKIKKFNINNIIYIDIDDNIILSNELFITSVPLFKIYKNKICIEDILGSYNNLENILKNNL